MHTDISFKERDKDHDPRGNLLNTYIQSIRSNSTTQEKTSAYFWQFRKGNDVFLGGKSKEHFTDKLWSLFLKLVVLGMVDT